MTLVTEVSRQETESEFQRFEGFIERQLRDGTAEEVAVDPSYGPGELFGGRWFRDVASGEVWRLIAPDPPFHGLWQAVRR